MSMAGSANIVMERLLTEAAEIMGLVIERSSLSHHQGALLNAQDSHAAVASWWCRFLFTPSAAATKATCSCSRYCQFVFSNFGKKFDKTTRCQTGGGGKYAEKLVTWD